VVRRVATPKPSPLVHRLAVRGPKRHRVVAKAHLRRPRPAHVAAVAAPKRCVVLHSERLSRADLAYGVAPLATSALDVPPGNTPPVGAPETGAGGAEGGGGEGGEGGAAFPNPASGGGAGGGPTPIPTKPRPVSDTPEPQTWMLTILGVGLCGAALRRAHRNAEAGA